jgi:16S rRNA (guanine966-N2)-methyltransferase
MRIIAGLYKGHKLVSFDEDHIRPTTDRVKESVFNILAPIIEGARVLDLFSGTGNLGLEALSRGASTVDMVEKSPKSIAIIRKNIERLKVTNGIQIHREDAVGFVKEYHGEPFELVLIDPPFPLKVCQTILEAVSQSKVADSHTRIVIEYSRKEPLPEQISTLSAIDTRGYGDKLVKFYKKKDL